MICPYCDSLIRNLPDNRTCPQCGAALGGCIGEKPVLKKDLVFPEPPVGVYKDVGGYIAVEKDSITFYRHRWPFTRKTYRTIPFHEIYAVSYIAPTTVMCGAVCVRQWQDRHIPLPTNDFSTDETSVYFAGHKAKAFMPVYHFLKQCADIVNVSSNIQALEENAGILGKYNGLWGYMELGENTVTFYKQVPLSLPVTTVIPYCEIAEVRFWKAMGCDEGCISIRRREEGKLFPVTDGDRLADGSTIGFSQACNETMRRVYDFLMDQVRENVRRWTEN